MKLEKAVTEKMSGNQLVIVEGLIPGDQGLTGKADYKIYVETPLSERMGRRLIRDAK